MTVAFTLSLPEHTTIIEHYDQLFGEHKTYELDWSHPAIPRIGDNVDGPILNVFIDHVMKAKENLPMRWQVTDIKWIKEESGLLPLLHVVGKWGPA